MALTVQLKNNQGDLLILDDEIGIVGNGKATPSKSFPGFVTLRLDLRERTKFELKTGVVSLNDFLVIRVPINWLEQGVS